MNYVAAPHPLERVSDIEETMAWIEKPGRTTSLTFVGEEGIGKTSLIRNIQRRAVQHDKWLVASLLVERLAPSPGPVDALLELRYQISQASKPHKFQFLAFDLGVLAYFRRKLGDQRAQRLEEDLTALSDPAYRNALKSGAKLATALAHASFLGDAVQKSVRKLFRQVRAQEAAANSSEAELLAAIEDMDPAQIQPWLPQLFAADLKDYLEKDSDRRIIITIDEYGLMWGGSEALQSESATDEQAPDSLLRCLVDYGSGALFVIADRSENFWVRRREKAAHCIVRRLEPLGLDVCRNYLRQEGLPPHLVEGAAIGSHGLPLWLTLVMKTFEHRSALGQEIMASNLPQVDDDLLGVLNRGFSKQERRTLMYLSSTVWFDRGLFVRFVSDPVSGTGLVEADFDEFVKLCTINCVAEGIYEVIATFRKPFHRVLEQGFPKLLEKLTRLQMDYFNGLGIVGLGYRAVGLGDAITDFALLWKSGEKDPDALNAAIDRVLLQGSDLRSDSDAFKSELNRLQQALDGNDDPDLAGRSGTQMNSIDRYASLCATYQALKANYPGGSTSEAGSVQAQESMDRLCGEMARLEIRMLAARVNFRHCQ